MICRHCGREIRETLSAEGNGIRVVVHVDTWLCSCAGFGPPWAEAVES